MVARLELIPLSDLVLIQTSLLLICKLSCSDAISTIFSRRPRRLFQNWPCEPGVYSKQAFNRGPAFIYEVQFSVFVLD